MYLNEFLFVCLFFLLYFHLIFFVCFFKTIWKNNIFKWVFICMLVSFQIPFNFKYIMAANKSDINQKFKLNCIALYLKRVLRNFCFIINTFSYKIHKKIRTDISYEIYKICFLTRKSVLFWNASYTFKGFLCLRHFLSILRIFLFNRKNNIFFSENLKRRDVYFSSIKPFHPYEKLIYHRNLSIEYKRDFLCELKLMIFVTFCCNLLLCD